MQPHEQQAYELLITHKENIKQVLNIGVVSLPDATIRFLEKLNVNPKITYLEIFEENCKRVKLQRPDIHFVQGDVRNIKNLIHDKFDLIVWWHGPEHIYEHELVDTILNIESLLNTNGVIILGSPDGWLEQHNDDGNLHNDHYSGPDCNFYRSLNYEAHRVWDGSHWCSVAYKKV